jgi:hypothetical protein
MVTQHVVGGRYAGTIFGGFAAARGGGGGGGVCSVGSGTIWDQRQHGDSLGATVRAEGLLPGACFAEGMTKLLGSRGMRIFRLSGVSRPNCAIGCGPPRQRSRRPPG